VCGGRARIAGHRIRVQDIVLWTEQGRSPDQIVAEFPRLSLADVYAALAYCHDHRDEIDRHFLFRSAVCRPRMSECYLCPSDDSPRA